MSIIVPNFSHSFSISLLLTSGAKSAICNLVPYSSSSLKLLVLDLLLDLDLFLDRDFLLDLDLFLDTERERLLPII